MHSSNFACPLLLLQKTNFEGEVASERTLNYVKVGELIQNQKCCTIAQSMLISQAYRKPQYLRERDLYENFLENITQHYLEK
jgi:hypothetical protein